MGRIAARRGWHQRLVALTVALVAFQIAVAGAEASEDGRSLDVTGASASVARRLLGKGSGTWQGSGPKPGNQETDSLEQRPPYPFKGIQPTDSYSRTPRPGRSGFTAAPPVPPSPPSPAPPSPGVGVSGDVTTGVILPVPVYGSPAPTPSPSDDENDDDQGAGEAPGRGRGRGRGRGHGRGRGRSHGHGHGIDVGVGLGVHSGSTAASPAPPSPCNTPSFGPDPAPPPSPLPDDGTFTEVDVSGDVTGVILPVPVYGSPAPSPSPGRFPSIRAPPATYGGGDDQGDNEGEDDQGKDDGVGAAPGRGHGRGCGRGHGWGQGQGGDDGVRGDGTDVPGIIPSVPEDAAAPPPAFEYDAPTPSPRQHGGRQPSLSAPIQVVPEDTTPPPPAPEYDAPTPSPRQHGGRQPSLGAPPVYGSGPAPSPRPGRGPGRQPSVGVPPVYGTPQPPYKLVCRGAGTYVKAWPINKQAPFITLPIDSSDPSGSQERNIGICRDACVSRPGNSCKAFYYKTDGSCYLLRARGRFVEGSHHTLAACFVVHGADVDFDEFSD